MSSFPVLPFLTIAALIAALPLWPGFGPQDRAQARLFRVAWAVWILGWGVASLALATGFVPVSPQPLRMAILFGGQIAAGVAVFALVPAIRRAVRAIPLGQLVAWQQARVVGLALILGAAFGLVSWPFALIAGLGDISVGVAAWHATRRTARMPDMGRALARKVTAHGMADFVVAIGTALATGALIAWPLNMIPLYLVPMAVLAHLAVIDRLRAPSPLGSPPARMAVPGQAGS